jgi:hypothetical protein
MDSGAFDDLFAQAASRAGGIDGLFDAFFGFLHRKTDFYIQYDMETMQKHRPSQGFPIGRQRDIIMRSFEKFPLQNYKPPQEKKPKAPASSASERSGVTATQSSSQSKETIRADTSSSIEASIRQNKASCAIDATAIQVPIGNGGVGPNYYWNQTLKDTTVYVMVPFECRGKDVKCTIKPRSISLKAKDTMLLEGSFEDPVRTDECMWTIQLADGLPQIVLSLEKTRGTWWKYVVEGHPQIDTTKVDSTQRIGEYDEATQATIRKLLAENQDKMRMEADGPAGGAAESAPNGPMNPMNCAAGGVMPPGLTPAQMSALPANIPPPPGHLES